MGLGAVKLTDMEEYIRVVYGLLNNEAVETTIEGKRQKIRFLNPEIGLINTKDRIPLHISAYGPRSQALTARLGAGWKTFVSDVPGAMSSIGRMQQSWRKAGRASGDLYATAWTCGCVLPDGEPADSVSRDGAIRAAGRGAFQPRGHFLFVKPEERKFVTAELTGGPPSWPTRGAQATR